MAEPPGASAARQRWIAVAGAALALIAGLLIAALLIHRSSSDKAPPPASQGGLVVQTGRDDDTKLDPKRPLRCFVAGQFIGELPLADCAKRNGVATGALDVGIDQSGALAASGVADPNLTPLPSPQPAVAGAPQPEAVASSVGEESAAQAENPYGRSLPGGCWRAEDGAWSAEPASRTLVACARSLFGGVCLRPGEARFGRFGSTMLRLYSGRVSIALDGRNFRPFVDQDENCALPPPD